MSKNGNINASPTHLFFKIQNHNVPKKRELFMKILGIENDKLVYLEKLEKSEIYHFDLFQYSAH